jgi:putative ABC transport system substrate-binding protein
MHQAKRREFIVLLGSAAAWRLATFAQPPERMRRIGVVMAYAEDDPNGRIQVQAFL